MKSLSESTYRKFFAGFSLYISNSTNPNNESLCYHRLQNGTNSPPSVMSIQCEMIGRYVTIYNERLPEQTYPDYYSSTAELELCEVEVYGKCSITSRIFRAFLHIKLIVILMCTYFWFLKDVRGFLSMETIVWLVPQPVKMIAATCPLEVVSSV